MAAVVLGLESSDIAILIVVIIITTAYFTKGTLWSKEHEFNYKGIGGQKREAAAQVIDTRDIIEKLDKNAKDVIVFFGSQTGTAEDYASRLAKELQQRFGLKTMTADLEEYDFEKLNKLGPNRVACFFLATYGEGEPTDNATDFYSFIMDENVEFHGGSPGAISPLIGNKFVVFGLGNNTYEHFNKIGRSVDARLEELGATRIGTYGEGDDGSGSMEEDYLSWKELLFEAWSKDGHLEEREAVYDPALVVEELDETALEEEHIYVGEFNDKHLSARNAAELQGPFSSAHPYLAPVKVAKELFNSTDRNCIHMEFDISDSGLKYFTGDHIAVWPQNTNDEVERFLDILGLTEKAHQIIGVNILDPTAKVPFPTPTTFDAIVRYHMEINGPVSRQMLSSLTQFAPNDDVKSQLSKLGSDKDLFAEQVTHQYYNLAMLLSKLSNGQKWKIPFSFLIESLHHLQPRYYSISSSSKSDPNTISITAVVENMKPTSEDHVLKGVATNYILGAKQAKDGLEVRTHEVHGPRGKYTTGSEIRLPLHVRSSNFKLPSNVSKPIIMVGPGTGVAPFRAFVHERAVQASQGAPVGKSVLFFGCRNRVEDFIYADEWESISKDTDFLTVHTAFSREGPQKVYVQHVLEQHGKEVNDLLLDGAYFYVCGDANKMARDVQVALTNIISSERGISVPQAEEVIKSLRNSNKYQEDVW